MDTEFAEKLKEVHALMDEYRTECLWYMRKDYYPQTPELAIRVLSAIEAHGDLATFKRAGTIRQWLLQHSNEVSAS